MRAVPRHVLFVSLLISAAHSVCTVCTIIIGNKLLTRFCCTHIHSHSPLFIIPQMNWIGREKNKLARICYWALCDTCPHYRTVPFPITYGTSLPNWHCRILFERVSAANNWILIPKSHFQPHYSCVTRNLVCVCVCVWTHCDVSRGSSSTRTQLFSIGNLIWGI